MRRVSREIYPAHRLSRPAEVRDAITGRENFEGSIFSFQPPASVSHVNSVNGFNKSPLFFRIFSFYSSGDETAEKNPPRRKKMRRKLVTRAANKRHVCDLEIESDVEQPYLFSLFK